MKNIVNSIEPVGVRPETAEAMLGVSRATIYRMLADRDLEKIAIPGRRITLISLASIRKLASGPTESLTE